MIQYSTFRRPEPLIEYLINEAMANDKVNFIYESSGGYLGYETELSTEQQSLIKAQLIWQR